MRLSTAQNTQNLGTFHFQDAAFKSGDSSKDRQSGNPNFTPYQHGDQVNLQSRTAPLRPVHVAQPSALVLFLERLLAFDARFYISVVATLVFAMMTHGLSDLNVFLIALMSVPFFMTWYVMSFFNVDRVMNNLHHAQALRSRQQNMHIPATF